MSKLNESWSSFTPEIASAYLRTFGHPAPGSKQILLDILRKQKTVACPSILDLGCGNGQLYNYFKSQGFFSSYIGVDFSDMLLDVARRENPEARFIKDDLTQLEHVPKERFDFVIYSHVIELLESPEASLFEAKQRASCVLIRFYEPPEYETDTVELREMDVGTGKVPYLRRKMSKSYYQLMLSNIGCSRVDVYRDVSKDQVHVLFF
jgi:ubiquinone/menaquinone biosynthesis C-methylase UbiE